MEDNTLPVLAEIEAILRLSSRKVEHLEYAFCTARGFKYVRQTIGKVWSQANRQAHDKYGVRIVCLKNGTRHSKASQLINDDVSTATIARILGNSQRVVERSYAQISTKKVEQILHNLYTRQKIPASKG